MESRPLPVATCATVPDPPNGFSWKQVPQIKAAFVVPDGWHFLEETKGKTLAIFITRESISENGEFETGVSVNVFRNNPSAPVRLKAMVEGVASKYGSEVATAAFDPFGRLSTRFDSTKDPSGKRIRTVMIALVNVYTKTCYFVTFESPIDQWEKAWSIGEVVINTLALETEL